MKKAVFLDRDGIINKERGDYTYREEDFVFLPDLFEVLRNFEKNDYQLVVVTNQGGIAKGKYSLDEFRALDKWMIEKLANEGVKVLKTFFSPDHEVSTESISRKPESILFERALSLYNIDPKKSFMIGDSQRDIDAAERVGIKGIKVDANTSLKEIEHLIVKDEQ